METSEPKFHCLPCEICGKLALYHDTKRCQNCQTIERGLPAYLQTARGQAFARKHMPLLDDWVDGEPDAWDYEAVLTENDAKVVWSNTIVDSEGNLTTSEICAGWHFTWKYGAMFIGDVRETIARKAAAMFISLWLRGVTASFADKLMYGYLVFLERQEETVVGFRAEIVFDPLESPFFLLTRGKMPNCKSFTPHTEKKIIEALDVQPGEEVIITFRKRKTDA